MFLNASTSFICERIQSCAKNVVCRLSRVSNWPRVAYFVLVTLISRCGADFSNRGHSILYALVCEKDFSCTPDKDIRDFTLG